MFPASEIVKKAIFYLYNRDLIAYFMGAKGEILTMERMSELISWFPDYFSRYEDWEIRDIMKFSVGKTGFDCSGLVSACVGAPGQSSWDLWDQTTNRTSVKDCKAGSFLYRPGHIGIDIGYGYCVDIAKEGEGVRLIPNDQAGFEAGGEYIYADYSMMQNY